MANILVVAGCSGDQFLCDTAQPGGVCQNQNKESQKTLTITTGSTNNISETQNGFAVSMTKGFIDSLQDGYAVVADPQTSSVTPFLCNVGVCAQSVEAYVGQICSAGNKSAAVDQTKPGPGAASVIDPKTQELIDVAWIYLEKVKEKGKPKYADKAAFEAVVKKDYDSDKSQCRLKLQGSLLGIWKDIVGKSGAAMMDKRLADHLKEIDPDYSLSSYGAFGTLLGIFPSANMIQKAITGSEVQLTSPENSSFPPEVQELVDVAWTYLKDERVDGDLKYANKAAFEAVVKKDYDSDKLQGVLNLQGALLRLWKEYIYVNVKDGPKIIAQLKEIDPESPLSSYGAFGAKLGFFLPAGKINEKVSAALEVLDISDIDVLLYGDLVAKGYSDDDIFWLLNKGYKEEQLCELPDKNIFIDEVLLPKYSFLSIEELGQAVGENAGQLNKSYIIDYATGLADIEEACLALTSPGEAPAIDVTAQTAAAPVTGQATPPTPAVRAVSQEEQLTALGYSAEDVSMIKTSFPNYPDVLAAIIEKQMTLADCIKNELPKAFDFVDYNNACTKAATVGISCNGPPPATIKSAMAFYQKIQIALTP
jgi:hypothetical protein